MMDQDSAGVVGLTETGATADVVQVMLQVRNYKCTHSFKSDLVVFWYIQKDWAAKTNLVNIEYYYLKTI